MSFSRNEVIAMMLRNSAKGMKDLANHVEKYNYSTEYIIEFIREIADEQEAQAVVVDLRDTLKNKKGRNI